MNINIKLDKSFTTAFNKLKEEYGEQLVKLNGFSEEQLNYTDFIDNFVDKNNVANVSIDSNANVGTKDCTSLLNEMNKPHMKLLSFNKIFFEMNKRFGYKKAYQWLQSEWIGYFYNHDAATTSFLSYCFSYDLTDLAKKGLYFINNFNAQPPQHLTTFTDFVSEYVSWVSNRTSGGCSLPDFLIWSFYFWKKDVQNGFYIKSPEYYRDQEFQRHIYKLNQPFLRITQCAYTTMAILDKSYLIQLFGGYEYPDGTFVIDYIDQILEYQKAFMDVVRQTRSKNYMTFPVISYQLIYDYEKQKFAHQEFARWCSDSNAYWMDCNFSIDSQVNALSSCCRLRNDVKKIGKFSSIGGSALQVGSIKVNSVNLARIAYESKTEEQYLSLLKQKVSLCCQVLDVIRGIIKRNVQKGLLPNYNLKMINMDKQYSTVGVCALYECIKHFGYLTKDEFGNVTYTQKGIEFSKKIFDVITQTKDHYGQKYNCMYNIEQIPGERACVIFMKKDKFMHPQVKYEGQLYSNQWISLSAKTSMKDKAYVGKELGNYMSGGVIEHWNMSAPFNNKQTAWKMLNYMAKNKIPYFAFNGKQNVCKHNHGFYGDICPECGGQPYTQYTRIVGFSVPIVNFSKQRKDEFSNRTWASPLDFDKLFD